MSSVKSAFAGAVAAATAITVSFPFELARVRVQTRTAEEEAQEVLDGVSYWTRLRSACDHALSPALGIRIGHTLLTSTLYYYFFETIKRKLFKNNSFLSSFLGAQLAGILTVVLTTPVDVICVNAQVGSSSNAKAGDRAGKRARAKSSGSGSGSGPLSDDQHEVEVAASSCCRNRQALSVDTAHSSSTHNTHDTHDTGAMAQTDSPMPLPGVRPETPSPLALSTKSLSLSEAAPFPSPAFRHHSQPQPWGHAELSDGPATPATTMEAVAAFVKTHWRGVTPSIVLCLNPAIHFAVFDSLKASVLAMRVARGDMTLVRGSEQHLGVGEGFAVGVAAKLVATIITFPLLGAKVKLMTGTHDSEGSGGDAGGGSQTTRTSTCSSTSTGGRGGGDAARMVRILYFTAVLHGLKGLYAGVEFHLIGTSIKAALSMALRERFMALVASGRGRK